MKLGSKRFKRYLKELYNAELITSRELGRIDKRIHKEVVAGRLLYTGDYE